MQQPSSRTRALLVADCGSVYTKVALIGLVEGRYRLQASAQVPSTIAPPVADLAAGVHAAIEQLERISGRILLQDGKLLVPMRDDGAGVDGLALATSAGGPLRLLAAGPGREALAALLHRAIGGLFVQLESLPEQPAPGASAAERGQLVAQMRNLAPHGILVLGSPFGAGRAGNTMEETGQTVAVWLDTLQAGAQDGSAATTAMPVIFSGSALDTVTLQGTLGQHGSAMQQVEPLSPSSLAPLNRAVSALYERTVLQPLQGYEALRAFSTTAPASTVTALGGLVRFLAHQFQTAIVGVDVGASSTAVVGATMQGEFLPAAHPRAGVGPGAGYILRAANARNVLRWLTSEMSESELRDYVLMRIIRPRAMPATARELEIEHALAREAIRLALQAPGSRLAGLAALDVVLGTGGVLAHAPDPAMSLLTMLDALQPRGITSFVLDTAHLANMIGGVAALDQAAAGEVAEGDTAMLQLGSVISTTGSVPEGQLAVRAVLEFGDGRKHVEDVLQGSIVRLPLGMGERALLGLYPGPAIDVGLGPGQQARASEPVEGGAVGLVIDARGRPLTLPEEPAIRAARQAQWRRALGLEVL
jgi:hypothetical protein